MSLINCLSKKHPTLESAMFGPKMFVTKHIVETLHRIWYKLRMMGVPIEVPRYINGDNMSVIYNT